MGLDTLRRIIFNLICVAAIMYGPWLLWIIVLLVGIVLYFNFIEIIFYAYFFDVFYGIPNGPAGIYMLKGTFLAVIALNVALAIRKKFFILL